VVVAALARKARVTVVAARGNVWARRSALAGVALHLRPDQWRSRLSMKGRSLGRGRRRVLGWAQGGCGVGRTIGGSTFRRAGSQGGRGELPVNGGRRQKSASELE